MPNYRTPKRRNSSSLLQKEINVKKTEKKTPLRCFLSLLKYEIVIGFAILFAIYFGFAAYINSLPPIANLENFKPNVVTKIYSADGEIIKTFTGFKSKNVTFEEIPDNIKQAIIATEDKNFYKHKGYDPLGLVRSILANIKEGHFSQGASTITQQLARVLFLSNEKSIIRKVKELIIATRIEKSVSKDKILEMYLNNVYLGSSSFGVAAAAEVYFGKNLNQLTLAEAALISGLPQAPSIYTPFSNKDLAIKRRNHVLNRMYKMNYITKEQLEKAKAEKVNLNKNPDITFYHRAGYFVDYVMAELKKIGFSEEEISQGGYKITTTLNYKAQRAAEESVLKNLGAWGLTQEQQQAAVFAINPNSGEIYVYVGGKKYGQSQYDRVSNAIRPPGSSFKPFVFAAALERGYDPNELVDDTPFTANDKKWTPKNYGDKYRGKIPMFTALTVSSNVVAARIIQDIGVRPVISLCRALGLSTPLEHDYTIALGSNGVKLSEMVVAYGAFANDGYKVKPYAVEKIETSRGKVIYTATKKSSLKVLDSRTAMTITAMMKTVITNGTGRAANIGKPAAGKTGTTDNYKDAWFVGFTPDVVAGVWVGKDNNSNMTVPLTGGTVPALIWKDTMTVATAKFGNKDFPYPAIELKKGGNQPQGEDVNDDLSGELTEQEKQEENTVPAEVLPEANQSGEEKTQKVAPAIKFNDIPPEKILPGIKKYNTSQQEQQQQQQEEEVVLPAPLPAVPQNAPVPR